MSNFLELKSKYDLANIVREQLAREVQLNGESPSIVTKWQKLTHTMDEIQQEIQKELGLCDE